MKDPVVDRDPGDETDSLVWGSVTLPLRTIKTNIPWHPAMRYISGVLAEDDDLPFDDAPSCEKCGGDGYVDEEFCWHCNGTGDGE